MSYLIEYRMELKGKRKIENPDRISIWFLIFLSVFCHGIFIFLENILEYAIANVCKYEMREIRENKSFSLIPTCIIKFSQRVFKTGIPNFHV